MKIFWKDGQYIEMRFGASLVGINHNNERPNRIEISVDEYYPIDSQISTDYIIHLHQALRTTNNKQIKLIIAEGI